MTPFAALFGRTPVRLTALEQPELLPQGDDGEEYVKKLGFRRKELHDRLADTSDAIKRAAVEAYNRRHPTSNHQAKTIAVGDKVWLTFSSKEKARYIRKSMVTELHGCITMR